MNNYIEAERLLDTGSADAEVRAGVHALLAVADAIRDQQPAAASLDSDALLDHETLTVTNADREEVSVTWANRMIWLEERPLDGDGPAITLDTRADEYERLGHFFLSAAATLRAEAPE